MYRIAAFSVAFSLSLTANAQVLDSDNCHLDLAPPNSGEIFFATAKVTVAGRVYPRLSDIPADYSGCQVLWASINGERTTRSVTSFRTGRVVAVSPLPDGIPLCNAGEKAAETGCTSRKTAVQVSYPAGCAARTLESKTVPRDCIEAFRSEFTLHDRITD
jgi:hypothetical protein